MKNNTNTQRQLAMKSLVLAMAGAGLLSLPQHVLANPTGGQVVAGNVTIRQESATKVGITQTTDKGIIDWQKFSIGANEHVQFYQPSASSVTLNRVVGQDPSQILGRLTANGQIFLVNPNGIFFGKNAQIDVAGLVASTHNIRNEDFLAGKYNFNIPGKPGAAVINEGNIRIADTGIAAFVAPSVANRGVIVARLGKVALAAANGFTLDFHGDQLLSFLVSDDVAKTAFDLEGQQLTSFVENSGRIEAQGGYVLLTAKAAESAIHGVINHSGVIEATTVGTQKGEIILHAGKGSLEVSGTLDASAPNGGDGGFIDTSGGQVSIAANTRVNTGAVSGRNGLWLIDPLDITINGSIAQAISTALNQGDVTVTTSGNNTPSTITGEVNGNGDIFVNGAIGWSANKFTLFAHRNIYFNNSLSGSGTAKLALQYGQGSSNGAGSDYFLNNGAKINLPAGDNFSAKQGASGIVKNYTVITSLGSQGSVTATDLQGMNGNLSKNYVLGEDIDASATRSWNGGAGFKPIGQLANTYTGTFDGLGHVIRNLYINRPSENEVGLIGSMTNSLVKNIGASNVNVTANFYVGGLVGIIRWGSTLKNSFATGSVAALGGTVGGLVGWASPYYYGSGSWCGACITIDSVYAMSDVTAPYNVGGLIGVTDQTRLSNAYATGSATASGVNGDAAGLVAYNFSSSITNSYSTGRVQGPVSTVGGLVARYGSATRSYWDSQTSGRTTSAVGTGKATAQMQQQATYTGWDFVNTWVMSPGSYPALRNSPSLTPVVAPPVTPPVTPQPPSNANGREVLSVTYVPPDAGQYAARVASAIYEVPKSPVVDHSNVFDQFKSKKMGSDQYESGPQLVKYIRPIASDTKDGLTPLIRGYLGSDEEKKGLESVFLTVKNAGFDEGFSETLTLFMAEFLKVSKKDTLKSVFGDVPKKFAKNLPEFSNKLGKKLTDVSSKDVGKNVIKGVLISLLTDLMKDELPSGPYWESMGEIAIDMIAATVDSFISAPSKGYAAMMAQFQVNLTIQLSLISAKAVAKDVLAVIEINNQFKENLQKQADSIIVSAQYLHNSRILKNSGFSEKSEINLNIADKRVRTSPVAEQLGLSSGLTYGIDSKFAEAIMLKASGDARGAQKLVDDAIVFGKHVDTENGLNFSNLPERMISNTAGYTDYAENMANILGFSHNDSCSWCLIF